MSENINIKDTEFEKYLELFHKGEITYEDIPDEYLTSSFFEEYHDRGYNVLF